MSATAAPGLASYIGEARQTLETRLKADDNFQSAVSYKTQACIRKSCAAKLA